jgi:hypothetical protein
MHRNCIYIKFQNASRKNTIENIIHAKELYAIGKVGTYLYFRHFRDPPPPRERGFTYLGSRHIKAIEQGFTFLR